jgi:hypothetical protein
MDYRIRLTANQHEALRRHLFCGDGKESAALVLCGRAAASDAHSLCVRRVTEIPNDACVERTENRVIWPTRFVDPLLAEAATRGLAILKVHSHPSGYPAFSTFDDAADRSFLGSVHSVLEDGRPHASAVMLPDGRIFARVVKADGSFDRVGVVSAAGDDLRLWYTESDYSLPEFVQRHAQAFGQGTALLLRRMAIAVVGCSGTGSPLVEQLVRLGVGRLVLVDPDRIEYRNLNRINFSTAADALARRFKVEVIRDAVARIGLGTDVVALASDLGTPDAVRAVAQCDVVFGCVDSWYGRDLLNRLATFYLLPYIDLGVQLRALPGGGIDQINGAIHYMQPGLSSLASRGVYDFEDVRAEVLKRDDPDEYARRLSEKYIKGVQEDRPAVISVNTQVAAMAVNELLARVHPFRYEPNEEFAAQWVALHEGHLFRRAESMFARCVVLAPHVGRGDTVPLLDKPELTESSGAA